MNAISPIFPSFFITRFAVIFFDTSAFLPSPEFVRILDKNMFKTIMPSMNSAQTDGFSITNSLLFIGLQQVKSRSKKKG